MASYIINVARRADSQRPSRHVFRTAQDSVLSEADAVKIANELLTVYPKETHVITVSYETTIDEYLNWESET